MQECFSVKCKTIREVLSAVVSVCHMQTQDHVFAKCEHSLGVTKPGGKKAGLYAFYCIMCSMKVTSLSLFFRLLIC